MEENSFTEKSSKVICITGASGFLGNAVAFKFARSGYRVLALSRVSSLTPACATHNNVTNIQGSVDDWIFAIEREKPISVFSFDWAGVERESRDDEILQESNIERVTRLAGAAKSAGSKTFMSFGSQAEIRPSLDAILESANDDPQSSYGAAKIATRKQIKIELQGSETRFLWGRIFTVYGPGDTRDSLITQIIRTLSINGQYVVNDPLKKWSFLEIEDFEEAIYRLHEAGHVAGIVNIGNPTPSTIGDVVDCLGEIFDQPQKVIKRNPTDPLASLFSWIPDTSTLSNLDWIPKVWLGAGLKETVLWWRQLPK